MPLAGAPSRVRRSIRQSASASWGSACWCWPGASRRTRPALRAGCRSASRWDSPRAPWACGRRSSPGDNCRSRSCPPSRSPAGARWPRSSGLTVYLAQRARAQSAQLRRTNRILEDNIAQQADAERRTNLALEAGQMGTWELDLKTDTSVRSLRHDQIFRLHHASRGMGHREVSGVSRARGRGRDSKGL